MEISSALGKIWLITRPAGISGKIRFDKDGSRRGWVFSHLIIRSSKDEWTARKVREIRKPVRIRHQAYPKSHAHSLAWKNLPQQAGKQRTDRSNTTVRDVYGPEPEGRRSA